MTNSQNPPDGQQNAPGENAPPTLQPSPLQQHAGQPERPLSELAGDIPEPSHPPPPPPTQPESNLVPDGLRTKSEASAYVGSYRPSDIQNQPPVPNLSQHPAFNTDQLDDHNDLPPPAYSEIPGQISDEESGLGTNAVVADDGRVNIRINQKSRVLTQIIGPQLRRQLTQIEHEPAPPPPYVPEFLGGAPSQEPPPPLNVVIHVVGSRGDVQPFVALGKVLKETYNHRVRLATHPTFKDFVTENGLEFFSIGGDPAELMAFMVKNPGLMPGFDTLRSGDVGKRRRGIAEILRGTWRSCIETGDGMGTDPLNQSIEEWMGIETELPEQLRKPFVADAIIANPPSFGHIHCAEKLGIPLHMMFTMPWSPTQQFPHPLANIQASNADASITNYMSYHLVDMLTWQGLGDIINKFRKESLGLDPISMIWGPGMLARLKIPYTYCWSPALIPKPKDWAHHISISGFFFLSLAQNYTPPQPLADFLNAGEPPVYIGFGSIVVDDPDAMTKMIFEAVKLTGRRALVSKGWGGLGGDELDIPEGVFMLGNCPHDWLFKRVSAVVHHGGAGTTAAGIAAGRPTVVVPFFGDQPFWGAMTARAGAGPMPIPYKDLTAEKLAESINEALKPESLERAQELSDKIKQEQGSQSGAQYFHQMLKYEDLRCAVAPSRPAVWRVRRTEVKLSAKAATVLAQEGELNFSELKPFRPREYETDEGPWDPLSGGASALIGTATTMMMGVADFPIETMKLLNIHPDSRSSKKGKEKENVSTGTGESSRTGRQRNTTQESAASSTLTLPDVRGPSTEDHPRESSDAPELSRSSLHHRRSSEAPEAIRPSTPNTPTSPGTPSQRSAFVTQALAAASPQTRSRSPSRERFRHCLSPNQPQHLRARSISAAELRSSDLASQAGTTTSTFTERLHQMNAESAAVTGKGIGRIVSAGFKSPLDFSLNIAKGCRNVPKLYGGDVRQPEKVTDLQSGLRTAAKEFGFGLYDGISGIVVDPYKGAKKEGATGFIKGVGRGLISMPFRMSSGAVGIAAYTMQGIYQEMMKGKGANVQNYIVAARISQGYDEASTITATERADIISRWKCIRLNTKKKKYVGEDQMEALHTLMADRRKKKQDRWNERSNRSNSGFRRPEARPSFPTEMSNSSSYHDLSHTLSRETSASQPTPASSTHPPKIPPRLPPRRAVTDPRVAAGLEVAHGPANSEEEEAAERREMEAAIAASVAESSRGNPEEDELIGRVIRASLQQMESAPAEEDDEETLRRAIQASINEAGKSGATEEEQRLLEEALKQSLLETSRRRRHASDSEWDSSDTEDDEEFQRILAESKELAHLQQHYPEEYQTASGGQESGVIDKNGEDLALKKALEESQKVQPHPEDLELKKVLEESRKESQKVGNSAGADEAELKKILEESEKVELERMKTLEKQKTEEEIVLEYVMKQSLAEEEFRSRMAQGRDVNGESSGSGGAGRA